MAIPHLWQMTPLEIRAYVEFLTDAGDDIDWDAQEGGIDG